jgi:hypothetical protein
MQKIIGTDSIKASLYKSPAKILVRSVMAMCIILDLLNIASRYAHWQTVFQHSCSFLTYLSPMYILFSNSVTNYTFRSCNNETIEPALSIIFFMIKLEVGIAVSIVILFLSINMKHSREIMKHRMAMLNPRVTTKTFISGCVILLLLLSIGIYSFTSRSINYFNTSILSKMVEDMTIYVIFFMMAIISSMYYYSRQNVE